MILLTGFEPFGDRGFNPSFAIAQQAAAILVEQGVESKAAQLPCVFATAPAQLDALLERYSPSVVIGLGLAAGRATMALEKVAINHIDARIVDNSGAQPIDVPVCQDGPNAYFSTLPLKAAVQVLRESGDERAAIDVNISYTAGSFVCNQMFYWLMHRLESTPGVRGGFVHVPWMDETDQGLGQMAQAVATVGLLASSDVVEPLISAGTEY